jgi:hypothetical protein
MVLDFITKNNLNTYLGFVENRALFFDGKNNTGILIYRH